MKYLRLLIIPLIMFMFVVPVKAIDDFPDWARTDNYYVVSEQINVGSPRKVSVYILSRKDKFFTDYFSNGANRGLWTPVTNILEHYVLSADGSTWETAPIDRYLTNIEGVPHRNVVPTYTNYKILYSNFDIYTVDRSPNYLVFPKTPVMDLAMVQQKALENLGMEVQGASWKISAAGGLILGAILVTHLVNRLRHWVRV